MWDFPNDNLQESAALHAQLFRQRAPEAGANGLCGRMLGPSALSSLRTSGSFSRRKKKSSPYGLYLPGTFHCVEVVRRRRLSQASRKGKGPLPTTVASDPTPHRSHAIAALLPQSLDPASVLVFHALKSFVQGHNWAFEVLFPQLQSRFISSRNVLFASRIIKLFLRVCGCSHGPQGFCLLGLMRLFNTPELYSFPCRSHNISSESFPSMPLYNASQKACQSASTRRGPHLSLSMWLTFTKAFNVSTSSALNVNSSEFSLTITSGHPSGTFGFRTLNVPVPLPRFKYPTSRARSLSTLMNSRKPFVRPFLLSLPRSFTTFCKRPSPSSC